MPRVGTILNVSDKELHEQFFMFGTKSWKLKQFDSRVFHFPDSSHHFSGQRPQLSSSSSTPPIKSKCWTEEPSQSALTSLHLSPGCKVSSAPRSSAQLFPINHRNVLGLGYIWFGPSRPVHGEIVLLDWWIRDARLRISCCNRPELIM
jgi:hypothetical protein